MFGISRAPDFDRAGLVWFNVDKPLTLADLRGRLVILDFWTFCCINCIHVLPTLRRIEDSYPQEVTVIGVHSPKFEAERDPAKVAQAIARYDIRHPVVHDPHMALWSEYAVRAWPTLVFVSPDGHVIGQLAGEPHPDLLVEGVGDMVESFLQRGELNPAALPAARATQAGGRLSFPGKIKPAPTPAGRKLWAVADAGHHQIVLFDDDGAEIGRYGSGRPGFVDGPAETAAFGSPQGLACTGEAIFVADTGNHAIRRIDRASGQVTTLAGVGARGGVLGPRRPAAGVALASPWDVEVAGPRLFFANAGSHQLGEIDLRSGTLAALAGNGAENIVDGPAGEAQLAQPSGLALSSDGGSLFFADSETSAVRRLALDGPPRVETLVGHGLFEFGHRDGDLAEARLQHPLGVAVTGGAVLVADSYNDAIRRIDLAAGQISTLGPGLLCCDPICLPVSEPAGVAADGPGRLLLSDTNNHRILEYRLAEGRYRTWAE